LIKKRLSQDDENEVVTFTSPPMPKDLLDRLIETVIQDEGNERSMEWLLNEDGTLDLFIEGI
jgi:hypothetical protein